MGAEHVYFNAFNLVYQVGSVRFRKLLNFFPDMETAWGASVPEFTRAGIEEAVVAKIIEARKQIDPWSEFEKLKNQGARLIICRDPDFPELLKEIPNPPVILYV